jgi:uncharacterized phage protein gp47/JayE
MRRRENERDGEEGSLVTGWPIPAPGDISNRAASVYEVEFARIYALRNPTAPAAVVDARSPNSTLAVHARIAELSVTDAWLYLASNAKELMPDTAWRWLSRHAAVWNVPRDQPTSAAGSVTVLGAPSLIVAAGEALSVSSGALYTTTAAGTLSNTGTGTLAIAANLAGSAGNLAAGVVLEFVVPVEGLNPQTATVIGDGITDGQDLEPIEDWRQRILQRIRFRGAGGSAQDYTQWVGEVLQNAICQPVQLSLGNVNVFLAMSQGSGLPPRLPTDTEIEVVTAYLTDATKRKPLGMSVFVTAFTLVPVNVAIALTPNTVPVQAAATAALQLFFAGAPDMLPSGGGTWILPMSNLDAALSNGSGETYHDRTAPSADQTYSAGQLPILGTLTFGGS